MLRNNLGLQRATSDQLPALWALQEGADGAVLVPVCAAPGHLHIVSEGDDYRRYLDGKAVATNELTKVEVQWLSAVANALAMCGDKTETVKDAKEAPHMLANVLATMSTSLHAVWHPASTAPLWVCDVHVGTV